MQLVRARKIGGCDRSKDLQTPIREERSDNSSNHAQEHGLGHQLTNDSPPTRPDSRSNCELVRTCFTAHKEEAAHVEARQYEHQ